MKEIDKYLNAHRLRMPNIAADRDNPIWYRIPGDFGASILERDRKRVSVRCRREKYFAICLKEMLPLYEYLSKNKSLF